TSIYPTDQQGFQPQINISCSVTAGDDLGGLGYALITRDGSSSGVSVGGPGNLAVDGPVYVASHPSSLPFTDTSGDVIYGNVSSACPTQPSNLSVSAPFSYRCIPDGPPKVNIAPPSALPPAHGATPDKQVGDCAIYTPGTYNAIDTTGTRHKPINQLYFASGV